MADPNSSGGLPGLGDPVSVRHAAEAATQTASELRKLNALVNSDVAGTVPDMWGGPAASALSRFSYRLLTLGPRMGTPLDNWANAVDQAAATMNQAKQQFQRAERFCAQNGLYLRPDLVVASYTPNAPDAQALVMVGQNQVNAARQLAELAQQQIRDANRTLEAAAGPAVHDLMELAAILAAGSGRRGGGGGRRTPRAGVTEAEMIRYIRTSPTTKIGQVSPPSTVPAGANVGNVMHDRVESVVRQNWPNVRFTRTPLGATGPDMPVVSRTPGTPDPGFDWVEIKPDSDSGIAAFVRDEWAKNSAWMGRGRIVTYDAEGNVKEIDFPAIGVP